MHTEMKLVIAMLFVAIFTLTLASPPHPCQCWPDWNPIKEGDNWHCKNPKSDKTFHCNIDIPPTCACKENGAIVTIPLGEVNCVGGGHNKYDNTNCESSPEWEAWFNKYPQYRLHQ